MKRFLILVAVFCFAAVAFSQRMTREAAQDLFNQANNLYQQQKYAESRSLYGQIIDAGIQSPELFYNMGNAAARLGKAGEAVLYYEKARRIEPRDGDIRANLRRVGPPDNDPQRFILTVPFHWLVGRFSLREWVGVFLAFFVLMGLLGAFYYAFPPRRFANQLRTAYYACALLAAVLAVFAGAKYYESQRVQYSVVMKPNAPVYSGPGEKFSQVSAAPEGTKVRRLPFKDAIWAQVQLMDGQRGFLLSESLREI